jgi:hypothetical protein
MFDPQDVLALGSARVETLRRAVRDDLVIWNSTGTLTPTGARIATAKNTHVNYTVSSKGQRNQWESVTSDEHISSLLVRRVMR